MNTSPIIRTLLAAILVASCVNGRAGLAPINSDERELFGPLNPNCQYGGKNGAEAKLDPNSRYLGVVLTKPEAGVGVKCIYGSTRLDPTPYITDAASCVELTFRRGGKPIPNSFHAVLETLDMSTKPAVRKTIHTGIVSAASAISQPDGWMVLRFPIEAPTAPTKKNSNSNNLSGEARTDEGKSSDITESDCIERVQILGTTPGAFEIRKIALVRTRNVSVDVKNPCSQNLEKLAIEGRTSNPSAVVTLKLVDATGQTQTKITQSSSGKYQVTWDHPPLTAGKPNHISASVGNGKSPLDQAVPREVFGYLSDTSHVWLKVKGRDIVTSPSSKGGERPFYPVGVGYGKNVLVRGYDEEVAAYCQSMYLNSIRLAFHTANFNGKAPLTLDDVKAFVDPVLEAAKRHNLYVILDDHVYFKNEINEETARGDQKSPGWTEERFQDWVNRWVQVASNYKNDPYILGYELCNEPVCSPETAQKWYRRCIEAIRKVDQRHIVIVGTHNWSHSRAMEATWQGIADKIDAPYNNVVFSFHDYPLDDDPWKVQANLRAFQSKYNVPVLCTEFGNGGRPEIVHRECQAGMLSLFAFDRIGWMVWSIYYDKPRSSRYPTKVVKIPSEKRFEVQAENPGYYIPFVELWAPTARMMGTHFPEPDSTSSTKK